MRIDDQHLPSGWCLTDIGSLGNYLNGRGFKKAEWSEHGRPIIRIQNLTGSSEKFNYFEGRVDPKCEVEPGDLLMSWAATLGAFIWRGPSAVLNQHIFKVDSFIERRFHYFILLWALDSLRRKAHGSGMVHVTKGKFEGTPVLLPPLPEQHRIVESIESYLTRLDAAMANLERVQRNLKRYRASVLKAAVEGRLVPTEAELARAENREYEPASVLLERMLAERRRRWEEAELAKMKAKGQVPKNVKWKAKYVEPVEPDTSELPELPEGWCWAVADAVCLAIVSGSTPTASELLQGEGPVPFIKVYNLRLNGELDFTIKPTFISEATHNGALARSRVREGDVLTNIVGPPLGKVSVVTGEYPEWNINQAIAAFRPSRGVTTGWIRLQLMSAPAQAWLFKTSKTTTSQVNLAVTSCRRLPIPIPPMREQIRIEAEADRLLSVAFAVEKEVDRQALRLRRLRQSILKWAFEGRLVDQDPTDEPAAVLLERIRAERAAGKGKKQPRSRRVNARTASA